MCWPHRYRGKVLYSGFLNQPDCTTTLKEHSSPISLLRSIIHFFPSPNLSFCISSHLLCNCLFEVHVNQCPFPSLTWKFCWYIQSRGLNFYGKRFALHRTLNPCSGLCGSEQEHFSDYFTGYSAGKSVPLLRDKDKPHGSSVLVHDSGLCNIKCLGVSLPFLDGI